MQQILPFEKLEPENVYNFCPIRHPRCSPFKGLRVLLMFEKPVELWAQLITMGGGSSVRHFQADKDSFGTDSTTESIM